MNRKEEYEALLEQLQDVPPELEYTVQRAAARVRKRRRTARFIALPTGTLLGIFTAFVLMVNLVPTSRPSRMA